MAVRSRSLSKPGATLTADTSRPSGTESRPPALNIYEPHTEGTGREGSARGEDAMRDRGITAKLKNVFGKVGLGQRGEAMKRRKTMRPSIMGGRWLPPQNRVDRYQPKALGYNTVVSCKLDHTRPGFFFFFFLFFFPATFFHSSTTSSSCSSR